MALPNHSPLSGTQFRVGFGPRGTRQRLILTQIHVDRITGCDGRMVVNPDPSVDRVEMIAAPGGSRFKKFFKIPWQLRSEDEVYHATREALLRSYGHFANRIAFTPLGLDGDGKLSPDQSARAMLGASYALWAGEENKVPHQILISIHADSMAYQDFELALEKHFFPYRSAENPNSGLNWRRAARRWGVRNLRNDGQRLFECFDALGGNSGRDAAQAIHQIARDQPDIFKPKDIDRMSGYDNYCLLYTSPSPRD